MKIEIIHTLTITFSTKLENWGFHVLFLKIDDGGKVVRWLHSHVQWLYSALKSIVLQRSRWRSRPRCLSSLVCWQATLTSLVFWLTQSTVQTHSGKIWRNVAAPRILSCSCINLPCLCELQLSRLLATTTLFLFFFYINFFCNFNIGLHLFS